MRTLKFYKRILTGLFLFFIASGIAAAQNLLESGPDRDYQYAERLQKDGYLDLAIEQFELFLQRYPQEKRVPAALRRIAEGHFQLQQFEAARSAFEKLVLRFPNHPQAADALFQIARCFAAEGKKLQAARTYERFARFDPQHQLAGDAFLRAAQLYHAAGQLHRARRLLHEIIATFPQNEQLKARAQLALVRSFAATGETDRAFQAADAFLSSFSEVLADAEVWLIRARLHRMLGQYTRALAAFDRIIEKYGRTSFADSARLEKAALFYRLGRGEEADRLLQPILAQRDSTAAAAVLLKTEALLEQDHAAEAVSLLQDWRPSLSQRVEFWSLLARAQMRLQNPAEALAAFRRAASFADLPDSLQRKVLTAALEAAVAARDRDAGADLLRKLHDSQAAVTARQLFLEAKFHFAVAGDAPRTVRLLQQFQERFPQHPLADDAQALLAQAYESLQEWRMADREWERLLRRFPGSPHYEQARRHRQLIAEYFQVHFSDIAAELARLPQQLQRQNEPAELATAEIYQRFGEFPQAIAAYKKLLAQKPEPALRHRTLLRLGESYLRLGEKEWLQQRRTAGSWIDSAKVVFRFLQTVALDSSQAQKVDWLLCKAEIVQPDSDAARVFAEAAEKYPRQEPFEQVNLAVLGEQLPQVIAGDSTAQAEFVSRIRYWMQNGTTQKAQARRLLAQFHLLRADTAEAIAVLEGAGDGAVEGPGEIENQFLLCRLLLAHGRRQEAMVQLEELVRKYRYSPVADSALFLLAQTSFRSGNPQAALRYLNKLRQRRRLEGNTQRENADELWLRGQALEVSGHLLEANQTYLHFLRRFRGDSRADQVLLALAHIARRLQAPELARDFYREILQGQKGGAVERARLQLAQLEFEQQNYPEARRLALETFRSASDSTAQHESMKLAILSGLRAGQLQTVQNELKNFAARFPTDLAAQAEIQFEIGDLYLRRKNFKKAEEIFKKLRKKFKNTPHAIRGDFGLGKALLIQNKTDDALEVLTEIPKKYPGHPFLKVVYLNLGDFYQAQQQWANAMEAFSMVLADSNFDRHSRVAMRSLIGLYERQGYFDAALKWARQYLRLFPQDEQRLSLQIKIGSLFRSLGQYQEAIKQYRSLLPLADPQTAVEIQYYIGESYFEAGQFEQAIVEYLRLKYANVKTKFPWRTTAIYKAGICYMRLKSFDRARELFELVVRTEGADSIFGRSARQKIAEIERETASAGGTLRSENQN